VDFQNIAIFGALSVGAFFLSKLAIKGDNRVEERRREAGKLAAWCEAAGLPIISSGLLSYSVGDYSGCLFSLRQAIDVIGDQEASKAVLDRFLRIQLEKRLTNEEDKAALLKFVQDRLHVVLTATPAPAKESTNG
jgi:hypothetical protein